MAPRFAQDDSKSDFETEGYQLSVYCPPKVNNVSLARKSSTGWAPGQALRCDDIPKLRANASTTWTLATSRSSASRRRETMAPPPKANVFSA